MSGTKQNPYPSCIKCNTELSPQDSRGWEKIIDNSDCVNNPEGSAKEIWLCPNCIMDFQACKDKLTLELDKYSKEYQPVISALHTINNFISKQNDEAVG